MRVRWALTCTYTSATRRHPRHTRQTLSRLVFPSRSVYNCLHSVGIFLFDLSWLVCRTTDRTRSQGSLQRRRPTGPPRYQSPREGREWADGRANRQSREHQHDMMIFDIDMFLSDTGAAKGEGQRTIDGVYIWTSSGISYLLGTICCQFRHVFRSRESRT